MIQSNDPIRPQVNEPQIFNEPLVKLFPITFVVIEKSESLYQYQTILSHVQMYLDWNNKSQLWTTFLQDTKLGVYRHSY